MGFFFFFSPPSPADGHVLIWLPLLLPGAADQIGFQWVSLPPDFATPRSRRIDLGEEGGGGAANTRTQTLTCSPAERRKPGTERTARGAASPTGSKHGAPGAQLCAWAAALLIWGSPHPCPARFPPRRSVAGRTMLLKEYRICMPLTVDEYRIGQLYMISKHSHEQSDRGEGVEVVQNEPFEDPHHGNGQFTEKRVYLNSKLPSWARAVVPKIFYVTEKAWNYYPYTITEYTCSFLPKFSIHIETKYEDNKGSNDSIFDNEAKDLEREVCFIDIACDEIPERYYKESEDPKHFKSEKTGRGQLREGWRDSHQPIMCSYKLVTVKFEVWGLQTRVEQFVHKVVRDILLIGHRQAFAWVDEWYGKSTPTKSVIEQLHNTLAWTFSPSGFNCYLEIQQQRQSYCFLY